MVDIANKFWLFMTLAVFVLVGAAAGRGAEFSPAVVLAGTSQVTVSVRNCSRPVRVTDTAGREIAFTVARPLPWQSAYRVTLPEIPAGDGYLRFHFADATAKPVFLPVVERFHIVLSFDDGPARGKTAAFSDSPTWKVLEALERFPHGENNARRGICAVFFLLTSPDAFLFDHFSKGETDWGAAMIKETARRGHVLGVHWGGGYEQQTITHPGHAAEPAVGFANGHAGQENRLESELQQCADRITELTGKRPEFVRPTLWVYRQKRHPEISALPTYRRLGLKMILTDGKYPDGGYKIISAFFPKKKLLYARNLRKAFLSGERYLVFSMHDSNSQTAEALPELLEMIKSVFDGLDFGTGRALGQSGRRLHFAKNAGEAREVLQAKKRFVMFPARDY